MEKTFAVYILASRSRVLYIGVTSDLATRVWQHRHKVFRGFTAKYNVDRLVYYCICEDAAVAIEHEKKLKGWLRERKIALIESMNPDWRDLYEELEPPG